MKFDGARGDAERASHLLAGGSSGDMRQDGTLPRG